MKKSFENSSKVTNKVLTLQQFCGIMYLKSYLYIIIGGLALASCSTTKYVTDGEYLLNKVEVKADGGADGIDVSQLKSYVRQRGNSRWFSTMKIPLATYSMAGRDTSKWINRALMAMGEAPVVYD